MTCDPTFWEQFYQLSILNPEELNLAKDIHLKDIQLWH